MLNRVHIKKIALAGAVALITLGVYSPALRNDFVFWDDGVYVFDNEHIRSFTIDFFKWAFSGFYASNWHPLTWISHGLDYALWGMNPFGHHLTSILLHAINTFLVVILTMNLVEIGKRKSDTAIAPLFEDSRAAFIIGGVTGILFGLHPVHVESVAWVSERKDLLCAVFFLLSINAYVKDSQVSHETAARMHRALLSRQYLFSLAFFALALLSKPMAVSLPVVLLILDWYPLRKIRSPKSFGFALLEKLPFIALSAFSSVMTMHAQQGAMHLMTQVPLPGRVVVAAKAVMMYLWNMVLPLQLLPYYPYPRQIYVLYPVYVWSMLFVVGITLLCVVARKQKIWLSVWSYYLVTLLPVLGIIQVGSQAMADRYTYLPSFGPFLAIGVVSTFFLEKIFVVNKRWGRIVKGFSVSLGLVIAVSLSYLTIKQIGVWQNGIALWNFVIDKEAEDVSFAYHNRGISYFYSDEFDKAIADLNKAIALKPDSDATVYYMRGMAFYKKEKYKEAIADFDKTLALDPQYWEAFLYRNQALNTIGQEPPAKHDRGTAGHSDAGRQ